MKKEIKNPILAHLDRYGTVDKDIALTRRKKQRIAPFEVTRKKVRRMTVDLHGRKSDEAIARLREAFEECDRHGIGELLIIHGKGKHSPRSEGPVLKTLVLELLESEFALRVRSFRSALPREGGEGATVAVL